LAIQVYVNNALALPRTDAELDLLLGSGAPTDLSDFDQLLDAYSTLHDHCTMWQSTTFPQTVALADDVVHYGQDTVPTYYPALTTLANALASDPTDQKASEELSAILGVLTTMTTKFADNAATAKTAVQAFAQQTKTDNATLVGTDDTGGLYGYYNTTYGLESQAVTALMEDVTAEGLVLSSAQSDYERDIIIASTTATYAWVFPFGTIAAAVVAGVYGHRAVEALAKMKATRDQIQADDASIASDANLMLALALATKTTKSISTQLEAALPAIHKVEGVWRAIAGDLQNIVDTIAENIRQVPAIIMGLGIDDVMQEWKDVAASADSYRVNAFITVQAST
jgi:hypothetical protein